jgi:hypothetical protein
LPALRLDHPPEVAQQLHPLRQVRFLKAFESPV